MLLTHISRTKAAAATAVAVAAKVAVVGDGGDSGANIAKIDDFLRNLSEKKKGSCFQCSKINFVAVKFIFFLCHFRVFLCILISF